MRRLLAWLRTSSGVETDGLWWARYNTLSESWTTAGHATEAEALAYLREWMHEDADHPGVGMTEQTDAAEVETLADALRFGVTVGSVEEGRAFRESVARRLLTSDWLAAERAAAKARGAERALREAADALDAEVARFGRTDVHDPVRAGLIEGYRDAASIVRAAAARGGA